MDKNTELILGYFKQISAIPRCSGNEVELCAWLQHWATEHGLVSNQDAGGNLVIRVPGKNGGEHSAPIVIQGHMDMVCERSARSAHDFSKDPIQNIVEGDWMRADETTLGSDNGIAIAFAMALAADKTIQHPPLELLFTVKEEVGLSGVNDLKPGFIQGKTLINIDSELEGTYVVGCAGGETTHINLPVHTLPAADLAAIEICVEGCRGGHSGVDIDKNFANANKLLARILWKINQQSPLRISAISGGTAHNAISREAKATVLVADSAIDSATVIAQTFGSTFRAEHGSVEPDLTVRVTRVAASTTALASNDSARVIHLLNSLPHGVMNMSYDIAGFVETSNNLANISLIGDNFKVITSQRSTSMSRLAEITSRIYSIGQQAGGVVTTESSYPSWKPNMASPILSVLGKSYQTLFGTEAKIESIHAGLECSTIGDIYPGIDMISIGVTIENPHSPTERMYLPSVPRVWRLLTLSLEQLC